jgi:hypothetical protein
LRMAVTTLLRFELSAWTVRSPSRYVTTGGTAGPRGGSAGRDTGCGGWFADGAFTVAPGICARPFCGALPGGGVGFCPGNTGRGAWACAKYAAPMSKKIPTVMKGKRAICWLWSESLSRKLGCS